MNKNSESRELEKRFKNYDPKLHFTVTSQKLAQDTRLSWSARGLYLYLASNRHDYVFHASAIIKHAPNGRRSTSRALRELIHYGYVTKKQHTNKKTGRFGQTLWSLYYVPNAYYKAHHTVSTFRADGNPYNGHPYNGLPYDGNRSSNKYQGNKNQLNKYQSNKDQQSLERDDRLNDFDDYFECIFNTEPTAKVTQYFIKWINDGYTEKDVFKALKITNDNYRCDNPNAIASYINQCLKYPPKSKRSDTPRYHSRGDHDDSKYNRKAYF